MHVLMVCLAPPYPPHDGMRLRTWHLLQSLADDADVTILTWNSGDVAETTRQRLEALGAVVVLPTRAADLRLPARLWRQWRFVRGGPPPFVQRAIEERGLHTAAGRRALDRTVRDIDARQPIDVVVFEDEATFLLPFPELQRPRVVHKLNVFAQIVRDLRQARRARRAGWLLEQRGWRRFDADSITGADLVVATTPETERALADLDPAAHVVVVTNGMERRRRARVGVDVAFIGRMDLDVNRDAVEWFTSEVWPGVRARRPDARLRIIGIDPSPAVRALACDDIVVTGEVVDMTAACDGVGVGVVPLRGGMGIKNKTLDFMAMGIPVVTTSWGAEGLDAARAGLVIVPDAAAMTAEVTALLQDPGRARAVGDLGRAYVEQRHLWETQGDHYRAALATIVERSWVRG